MKLHHYLAVCFILMPFALRGLKPLYSAASYNPSSDEVVNYRDEPLPDYIKVHEEIHQLMRWEVYLILGVIIVALAGLSVGTLKVKYPYAAYVLLSMHSELVAYWLTPISLPNKALAIWVICGLGWINYTFWKYFFYTTDLKKGISKANRQDVIYSPLAALVFWVI